GHEPLAVRIYSACRPSPLAVSHSRRCCTIDCLRNSTASCADGCARITRYSAPPRVEHRRWEKMMDASDTPLFTRGHREAGGNTDLPHVIHVNTSSPHETLAWLSENSGTVRADITSYGAVLLRGIPVNGAPEFREIFSRLL